MNVILYQSPSSPSSRVIAVIENPNAELKFDFTVNPDSKPGEPPTAAPDEFNFRRAFARHWRESVRYYGCWRSLRELADVIWSTLLELLPSRRKAAFGDLDYDWEHSVDTTRSNVGVGTQFFTGITARPYFATEPWLFEQIMEALALNIQQSAVGQEAVAQAGLQNFTFIDLGSGKGRVLLMASDYPFKRIIGLEFMPELHRAAQKNVADYPNDRQRCRQIEAVCMDARDFRFPSGPLVVYLFNPFSEPTFAHMLENLRHSVEQTPRRVYIAYRFTEFKKLLAQAEWLEKIAGAEQWAVYKHEYKKSGTPSLAKGENMGGNEMRKHALRRYVICRIKDIELIHLNLILSELRVNKFTPENVMGHKSDDFARSMQTVALAWFATLVDQSRGGLNIFDVWRQLFPKHLNRINEVWIQIESTWNVIRTHRDRVAFHADKPSAYFKAKLNTEQNMDNIVKALDSFLTLSSFLSKTEHEELPDFPEVAKEMLKEIGEDLGCEINLEWFRKLLILPPEENVP